MTTTKSNVLAKAMAKAAVVADDGADVPESFFYDNLPKDLSKEVVEQVDGYRSTYTVAAAETFGILAKDNIDPEDESFSMSYSMGGGIRGNNTALKNTDTGVWGGHFEVKTTLDCDDAFDTVQQETLKVINNI